MDDTTPLPPPPPNPWESSQPPPGPEQPYPIAPPLPATSTRRSRLGMGAAITGGALALAAGAFFLGHAAAGGASNSTQPISTASAVNAAIDASNGAAQSSVQCVAANVAAGTLKSVNGTTLTVTDRGGKDVTVTTSSSTKITKVVNGTLSDVTPGAVIGVHGTASGQSGINAGDIAIIPSQKAPNLGKLPEGASRLGQRLGLAFGTVKSVSGNTVVLQEANGTTITVTTSSSTKVQKTVSAKVKDLTVGQPVVASGTANADGSIAATNVVQGSGDLGFKGFGLGGLRIGRGRFRPGGVAPAAPSTTAPAVG